MLRSHVRQLVLAFVVLTGAGAPTTYSGDGKAVTTASPVAPEGQLQVQRVLFLGNSITLHSPAPQIGWTGNFGMAASCEEQDYVHLLLDKMSQFTATMPEIRVRNIADFEREHVTYQIAEMLKPELDFQADLVIVAIGENVSPLDSEDAQSQFRTAFGNLLHEIERHSEIKQHGHPTILVRSCFWADPTKDEIMRRACADAGGVFVDIGLLGENEANFARSERQFEHAGVAGHPGDQGMQAISDEIWKALAQQSKLWKGTVKALQP